MSSRTSPAPNRRAIPIKRSEGEPLTRSDLQYRFLRQVFDDTHAVFTNPWPAPSPPKLTFRSLYINTLLNSTKPTKAFRDKLADSDAFAQDFAMVALLVNVGRINTTMSFFPEMKTTIRSYHPVPALQRTPGNLQDAPRIKHMLRAVALRGESNSPSHTPADILSRLTSGQVPPTTVTNLIFVLANHSATIGHLHLPDSVEFIDLFIRTDLSSASRANAFLWLCFNYLESPAMNNEDDYDDDVIVNPFGYPRKDGKLSFVHLTPEEAASENLDPPDELKLAEKLIEHRGTLLQGLQSKDKSAGGSVVGDRDDTPPTLIGEEISAVSKGKRKRENPPTLKNPRIATKVQKPAGDKMAKGHKHKAKPTNNLSHHGEPPRSSSRATRQRVMNMQNQYPPHQLQLSSRSLQHTLDSDVIPSHRFTPYQTEFTALRQSSDIYQAARARRPVPPRSFLQHAWLRLTTADPLVDSDAEGDEHTRHEYMQRLRVIAGIIGSPFSDSVQPVVQPPVPESSYHPQYM